jgi:prevent-host-death family protein
MLTVNMHEAKTHLSKYVEMVEDGEEVIICKNGHPVAMLNPYPQASGKRKLGAWKDKIWIAEDFDELPDDFMKHFE